MFLILLHINCGFFKGTFKNNNIVYNITLQLAMFN